MTVQLSLLYFEPPTEIPTYIVAILVFAPIIIGLSIFIYKTRHAKTWRKGVFPNGLKFNQDNLLEAYLALGARLVIFDYESSKNKTQFINEYFNQYFPDETYNFGDSLLFSMRHPIKIETVNKWLNTHLNSDTEKSQVIYFLTGIVMINGSLSSRELSFLTLMNSQLGLSDEQLKQTIAIYQSYYRSKEQQTGKDNSRKKSTSKNQPHQFKQAAMVLGISEGATLKEIKSAYRSLVKRFHPDVFSTSTDAQRIIAEEKFIQIQKAYETLSAIHA